MVYRVFVEKKKELAQEAKSLLGEARDLLGIKNLTDVRVINRYDAENITPELFDYAKRTVFDLVLPRILAGERLTPQDISTYGEGGLCLNCEVCHFPNCGFGK